MKILDRIRNRRAAISRYFDRVYSGHELTTGLLSGPVNFIRVFIAATRKFIIDDCFTKASSIAYTTIMSLIPSLAVALTIYSVFSGVGGKKEELFRRVSLFMVEHNIKLNIDPIFAAISGLVENAGKIGGIGAAIMVFSATAMLRSLEKSLNDIWRVRRSRPIFLKIVYYWAALTLGPIMLIAGTTVATQVSELLSSPNYNSGLIASNGLWVVGNKSQIVHAPEDMDFSSITDLHIDFDNQKVYDYDFESNNFVPSEFRVDTLEYRKRRFTDIQFIGDTGWIVGSKGTVLTTQDGGKRWILRQWGSFNFNDIHMTSRQRGFIVGDSGIMMETVDGGKNWQLREWAEFTGNFNAITFSGDHGLVVGGRAMILQTYDGGENWTMKQIKGARRKSRYVTLNDVQFATSRDIWIAGHDGIIVHSNDNGNLWKTTTFKENDYHSVYFENNRRGFIGGDRGILISTSDGGENWYTSKMPTYRVNSIIPDGTAVWALGDTGMIMKSDDMGSTWSGSEGKSAVAFLINFFAPFFFIWLLFLLAYMSLPNTRVPLRHAAIGASFTAAVWVLFILGFIVYARAFARGTFAIYGALAALPLFLLMVYASSLIILYGAEVAYTLMHPEQYLFLDRKGNQGALHAYLGVALLHAVYTRFEAGQGPMTPKQLHKQLPGGSDEIDQLLQRFQEYGYILVDNEFNYIPSTSSDDLKLKDIINTVYDITLVIPGGVKSGKLKKYMKGLFDDLAKQREDVLENLTLKDVIERTA